MNHLWHLLDKHGDHLKTLAALASPFVTLVAALTAGTITVALGRRQAGIAERQRATEEKRYRDDLNKRRKIVRDATHDLIVLALGNVTNFDLHHRELLLMRDASYVFPTATVKALRKIESDVTTLWAYAQNNDVRGQPYLDTMTRLAHAFDNLDDIFPKDMAYQD